MRTVTIILIVLICIFSYAPINAATFIDEQVVVFRDAYQLRNSLGTQTMFTSDGESPSDATDLTRMEHVGIGAFRAIHGTWKSQNNPDGMPNNAKVGYVLNSPSDLMPADITDAWADSLFDQLKDTYNTDSKKGRLWIVEMQNEPDLYWTHFNKELQDTYHKKVYERFRNDRFFDGIALTSPSMAFSESLGSTEAASTSLYTDLNNVHAYNIDDDGVTPLSRVLQTMSHAQAYQAGPAPVIVTEGGTRSDTAGSSERYQATVGLQLWLSGFKHGALATYPFDTYDWSTKGWGMFLNPSVSPWRQKQMADAVKRLIDELGTGSEFSTSGSRIISGLTVNGSDVVYVPVYNHSTSSSYVIAWRDVVAIPGPAATTSCTVDFNHGSTIDSASALNLVTGNSLSVSKSGDQATLSLTDEPVLMVVKLSGSKSKPAKPGPINASVNGNLATLNWSSSDVNTEGFYLYRKRVDLEEKIPYQMVAALPKDKTSYTEILPALPGKRYKYSLRASNWKNSSAYRVVHVTVPSDLKVAEDFLADTSKLHSKSANIDIKDFGKNHFDTDRTTAGRVDDTTGNLTWKQSDVGGFQIVYFRRHKDSPDNWLVKTSVDGSSYSVLDTRYVVAPARQGTSGTHRILITPAESLPSGTKYIRFEMSGERSPYWKEQTGRATFWHTSTSDFN